MFLQGALLPLTSYDSKYLHTSDNITDPCIDLNEINQNCAPQTIIDNRPNVYCIYTSGHHYYITLFCIYFTSQTFTNLHILRSNYDKRFRIMVKSVSTLLNQTSVCSRVVCDIFLGQFN